MFKCFWEHNPKLKLNKCKFFCNEINYLAHHVSKEGIWPSKENLTAVAELFPASDLHWESWAFLVLVGHYWQFIKGFAHVTQPLHKHLSNDSVLARRASELCSPVTCAHVAFETLKKTCLVAPVLAFANFDKPFLFETNASKLGLGWWYQQKQSDGWYHPVAYAS